jgi:leucyl aminopeptidase
LKNNQEKWMSISPIRFQVVDTLPQSTRTDCIVVGITPGGLSQSAKQLNKACGGIIQKAVKQDDIHGKAGEKLYLYPQDGVLSKRILLIGCGKNDKRDSNIWSKIISTAFSTLNQGGSSNATIYLSEMKVKGRNLDWQLQDAARVMTNATYKRGELKSTHKKPENPLSLVKFYTDKNATSARKSLASGKAIGEGMTQARRLGDLPANVCTPSYLASQARALARKHASLSVKVLNETQMEKLGMGSFLSVAAGSDESAKLIVLEHKGGKRSDRPVALVGKGVTFDTGGISLKPGASMDEMKYDMCGAASVLGTFNAIAALKLPINVVGVIPATENMPNGSATKPGDIVTSMSGKTIEVLNTDAEGRLILCDALTYVQQYKPSAVIDIATLTGAVIIALGHHISGLVSNNDKLAKEVLAAANDAQDPAWQLPLDEKFQHQLHSNFADIANIGGRAAGTITAGCFLSRFTEDVEWAHLDIAGTAWVSGTTAKGATGRPVPLLTQFLINRCRK